MMPIQFGALFTAGALCVAIGSNLADQRHAHEALEKVVAGQNAALGSASRAEAQLDALAKGTLALANAGNPNAARIVATLRANGVRISPK